MNLPEFHWKVTTVLLQKLKWKLWSGVLLTEVGCNDYMDVCCF